jgi:hypothetical protein
VAISVDGETGLLDVIADPGTATFGTGVTVVGKTAKIKVRAMTNTSIPEVVMTGGDYLMDGETAQLTVKVNPGTPVIGDKKPGDYWVNPTIITGSGTKTWDVTDYTEDSDEPPNEGIALYKSRWFRYASADTELNFELTGDGSYLEIYDAQDAFDSGTWVYVGGGAAPVETNIGFIPVGTTIVIRVATDADDASYDVTLDWLATVPTDEDPDAEGTAGNLQVDIADTILLETPYNLQFSLFNADDDATVTVSLVGEGQLIQYQADDSGVILGASIPIPELPAGTYSLSFTAGAEATIVTMQVLEDVVPLPTAPAADSTVTMPGGVHRWILQDPTGVIDEYEFTYNPSRMSSPHGARAFVVDTTTAPNGQLHIYEALPRAIEWDFSGFLDTEADLLALEVFASLRRKFFLIDHRDRAWVVMFTAFDPQPKRVAATPYAHDYTVKALIYGEAAE